MKFLSGDVFKKRLDTHLLCKKQAPFVLPCEMGETRLSLDIPLDLIFCDSCTRKVTGRGFFEDDCNVPEEQQPAVDSGYSMAQSVLKRLTQTDSLLKIHKEEKPSKRVD